MKVSIIAAIDENNGLGLNNQLLAHLPADLRHFKEKTLGKPIIMGRKTYLSIGRVLPQRHNIVLSKTIPAIEGASVYQSLESALDDLQLEDEVMIIGGETLYKQALPIATKLYITKIHHQFIADAHFPYIDNQLWSCVEELTRQKDEKNEYDVTFCIYERH